MRGKSILFVSMIVLFGATASSQSSSVTGIVTDPSGAVVAGATVTLTNAGTGLQWTTLTTDKGYYSIPLLKAGTYRLAVQAAGFKVSQLPVLALEVSQTVRQDFQLEIGELSQQVNVEATAPALDKENAVRGSVFNERPVQDLPLNGRNFIKLAQLAAGAQESVPNPMMGGNRPDDRRRTSALAVHAQREYLNNFLLDGMDNNDRAIGTQVVRPPVEAIQEFKVLTSLYGADLGRTGGGVISLVSKSGTNGLHGSLFEFLRNNALDAKNFFDPPGPTPPFKQNQFGASLGGPLRRDRTFFFGDYEGFRLRQAQTFTSIVPTAAMKTGNFAGVAAIFDPLTHTRFANDVIPESRMDPPGARLAGLYPNSNTVTANGTPAFVFNPVKSQREDDFDVRVDHKVSNASSFFTRYSFNDANTFLPSQLPPVGDIDAGGDPFAWSGSSLQRSQGLQLNYVRSFGPNFLGEFRAGYVRYAVNSLIPNWGKTASSQLGIPGANYDQNSSGLVTTGVAGFRGLGDSRYIPIIQFDNTFQEMADFSYTRSRHSLKMGADVRRRQLNLYQSDSPRGQFDFDANLTSAPAVPNSGNAIASLLLGYPARTTRSLELIQPGYRSLEWLPDLDCHRGTETRSLSLCVSVSLWPLLREF